MAGTVSYPLELASVMENHAAVYEESLKNPETFWGDLARNRLRWIKEFDQVMDCDMGKGSFKWFLGGVLNVAGEYVHVLLCIIYKVGVYYRCLDHSDRTIVGNATISAVVS